MTPRRPVTLTQGTPPMSELLVIASLHITAGQEDAVLTAVPKLIAAARTEPGNIAFAGYRSLDKPSRCLLVERYASRAAFNDHLAAPHYQEIAVGYIVPRLEGRTIEQFDVIPSSAELSRVALLRKHFAHRPFQNAKEDLMRQAPGRAICVR